MFAKSTFTALFLCLALFASLPASAQQAAEPRNAQQTINAGQAFALMTENAQKGDARAMLTLGSFYEQGVGTPRNFTQAMQWYQKAAAANLPEGHYNLGVCYEIGMGNAGDMKKAVQQFEKAAGLGLTPAMQKMASLYFAGNGVKKDVSAGLKWLNQAADKDDGDAANTLGVIYQQGLLEQKKDEGKAFGYFTRAANSGHLEAIKNLAVIYKDGLGRGKDPAMALQWYLIAQKGGYRAADLDPILIDLKKDISASRIQRAERAADDWIKAFQAKSGSASSN